jgi:hypothetical protein
VRSLLFFSSLRGIPLTFRFFILGLALLAPRGGWCAQTPEDAVQGLARRVGEIREAPEKVSVEWVNASSLPEAESIILRETFLKELSGHRVLLAAEPAVAAGVRISVRETPTEFLVVARVTTAAGEQVRMAGLPRTAFLPVMTRGNGLRLTKQLLWQQTDAIVDAGEFAEGTGSTGGTANIFFLKPDGVTIYREAGERLNEIQELPFSGYRYVSRGLRGEMRRAKDGAIMVAVPGLNCAVREPVAAGERWTMTCTAAPIATGATKEPTSGPNAGANLSTTDAEAVTLTSSCDGSSWRLIAEAADWTQTDRLLLVNGEMKREEAVASVEFAGPVRRLVEAEDRKSAVAIVFDLSSGSYEVHRVAMVCGR